MASTDWIAERGWVRPDHGGACFASLPGTITALLTGECVGPALPASMLDTLGERFERVVLVYFDAFSLEIAERHRDHPLLARAAADGVIHRLTSQFPSTTTAHMTTIHTGLPVGEHGLYEWSMLEPSLDRLIAPLPYTFAGDGGEPLAPHLDPARLYPQRTLYEWLADRGVASVVTGPIGLGVTPTSAALLRGATSLLGFHDVVAGLGRFARELAASPSPAYGFAYIEALDTLMHKVGPLEPERTGVDAEVRHLLSAIETQLLDALPAGTLLLLSADHGMTPVSPRATINLNVGEHAAEIVSHVRTGAEPGGHPLAPAGSCRDLFLHAKPGHLEPLVGALSALLGPRAEVRRTDELLDGGIFGPHPAARLRERLGEVVILPELGEAVYWHTPGRFRQAFWGQHGGLTPSEMEIPLLAVAAHDGP